MARWDAVLFEGDGALLVCAGVTQARGKVSVVGGGGGISGAGDGIAGAGDGVAVAVEFFHAAVEDGGGTADAGDGVHGAVVEVAHPDRNGVVGRVADTPIVPVVGGGAGFDGATVGKAESRRVAKAGGSRR